MGVGACSTIANTSAPVLFSNSLNCQILRFLHFDFACACCLFIFFPHSLWRETHGTRLLLLLVSETSLNNPMLELLQLRGQEVVEDGADEHDG
mmetsp:Transcript_29821/g.40443  ORF Transcript_29821/g.40443 Transcript_29821/m.40443 type:complete len:93 (-) Transcript_29821:544-822(-)